MVGLIRPGNRLSDKLLINMDSLIIYFINRFVSKNVGVYNLRKLFYVYNFGRVSTLNSHFIFGLTACGKMLILILKESRINGNNIEPME